MTSSGEIPQSMTLIYWWNKLRLVPAFGVCVTPAHANSDCCYYGCELIGKAFAKDHPNAACDCFSFWIVA
jgi:hypothetical protein